MGIEQGNPWGGIEMTPEEIKIVAAKRRAATEEGLGKKEDGTYDLDAQGENEVEPPEPEDPESKKAA